MSSEQTFLEAAEPPCAGEPTVVSLEKPLGGYIWTETIRRAFLPAVISYEQGKGHVSALLDGLTSEYDEVVVPGVISNKLAAMLVRRGFHVERHYSPAFDEHIECFVWNKKAAAFGEATETLREKVR